MTETSVPPIPEPRARDMVLAREFAATPQQVWTFWADPALLALWFGPTMVHVDPASVVVEMHEGGRWDLDMVDNESGARYPVRSKVLAAIEPAYFAGGETPMERADGVPESTEEHPLRLQIWFDATDDGTRITIHQGPFTDEFREMTAAGWELSFQKIDAILASA